MFFLRRRRQQPQQRKDDISHLVGKSRAAAIQALKGTGKTIQYIALKAGEQPPSIPATSVYIVCYDSITEIVTFAA